MKQEKSNIGPRPIAIVQDLLGKCYTEKGTYIKSDIIAKHNLKDFVAYTFDLEKKKLIVDFSTLKDVEKYKEIAQSFVDENFGTAEKLCKWIEKNFDSKAESELIKLLTKEGKEKYEKAIEPFSEKFAEAKYAAWWKACEQNLSLEDTFRYLNNEIMKCEEDYEKERMAAFVEIFGKEKNRIAAWR